MEDTALIGPVTDWVVNAAISQVSRWRHRPSAPRISINASALNLEDADFVDGLSAALARHDVAPKSIELEFTESALAHNSARVTGQMKELRDLGIEIAIDDFGTGYSSLSYLQTLPASILKIDRSFMRNLESSDRDRTLVRSMIGMAHDLGYTVVAEGVETQAAYDLLSSWGCDEAQGYHISRPVGFDRLEEWLQ